MKAHIAVLILIGILAVTPYCYAQSENSSTSIDEVKKETQDLLQSIGAYTAEQKDLAIKKAKEAMDKLDQRFDALEAKVDNNWDKMNKASRKEASESLETLRKQRDQVAEFYESMKTSSVDTWERMKNGFADAYMALDNAWAESEKKFSDKE